MVETLQTTDGKTVARSHTMIGGYPIVYVDSFACICCPDCAFEGQGEGQGEEYTPFINYSDPFMQCDECSEQLECAYPPELEYDILCVDTDTLLACITSESYEQAEIDHGHCTCGCPTGRVQAAINQEL